jgi:hypothetical protein
MPRGSFAPLSEAKDPSGNHGRAGWVFFGAVASPASGQRSARSRPMIQAEA